MRGEINSHDGQYCIFVLIQRGGELSEALMATAHWGLTRSGGGAMAVADFGCFQTMFALGCP
jgi:hypothetical protein